ncbi:hypothetical protein C8Q80DRAFT_898664 [Daedaleopsis nitida]|nr:hypothetical protein C8Q80DRAFT_898664 [Daedaleopsis nitida]
MSAPAPAPPSPLALIAGPPLLGYFFAWGLQGVLSLQTYFYYLYFPKDRLGLKTLVYSMLVVEWVHTGLVTSTAFEVYGNRFGDLDSLTAVHNLWFSSAIMSSVIAGIVQCYYARRLWLLSRSKPLVVLILALALVQTALGLAGGITLHVLNFNASELAIDKVLAAAGYIVATVDDVIIAIAMAYFLLRSKSGIKKSDAMLNRLARLMIETGALTSVVSLLTSVMMLHGAVSRRAIAWHVSQLTCPLSEFPKNTLLFYCPALVLPKLYSNTLLMSLNNRAFLRVGDTVDTDTSTSDTRVLQSVAFAPNNTTETYNLSPMTSDAKQPEKSAI